MREWNGIDNTKSDIGDDIEFIENGDFRVQGELQRRPGYGARLTDAGIVCGEIGSRVLFVHDTGTVTSVDQNTDVNSGNLITGYNIDLVPCLAQAFGRMFITNDFDKMKVSDNGLLALRDAGIIAPVLNPTVNGSSGAGMSVGTHLVRYRYQDQQRTRLSDPSGVETITLASGTQGLDVGVFLSSDPFVTNIIIEITPAGASEFYQAAIVANASGVTTVTLDDLALVAQVPTSLYGDFGHQPPPLAELVAAHRNRTWTWGATSRTIPGATLTSGVLTVDGTGFSANWIGRKLTSAGSTLIYIITAATTIQLTLDQGWAGANVVQDIVVYRDPDDLMCWSQPGFPESFDAIANSHRITLDQDDHPAGMVSYYSDLYLIGTRSMRRFVFDQDPGDASSMSLTIPGTMGAFHQRCLMTAGDGRVFGWGRDGIWMIDAMQPKKISNKIETTLAALASTVTTKRFVCYEPTRRIALFLFPLLGETNCRGALAFFLDTGQWQLWRFRVGMVSACLNSAYSDRQRLMLCDENGYSWRVGVASNDGAADGVVSVGIGSTTTNIIAVNSAVAGQIAYRPLTGEERPLATVSGAGYTVVTPYATALASGELVYIGSIRQRILSGIFQAGQILDKKTRPAWYLLAIRPNVSGSMGTAIVRLYRDFSLSPTQLRKNMLDTENLGISFIDNATEMTVDLDVAGLAGFVAIPLCAEWSRAMQIEIIAETPYSGIRFLDGRFSAASHYQTVSVIQS